MGVTGAYIQQLEKGIKTNPSLEVIVKICDALDVLPWEIASGDKDISEALARYYSGKYAEDIQDKEIKTAKEYQKIYEKIKTLLENYDYYTPEYEKQTEDHFDEIDVTITSENEDEPITIKQSTYVELGEKIFDDINKYTEMRVLYFLKELKNEE